MANKSMGRACGVFVASVGMSSLLFQGCGQNAFHLQGAHRGGSSSSASEADLGMQIANPGLFETASRYFPSSEVAASPSRLFRLTTRQLDRTAGSLFPAFNLLRATDAIIPDQLATNYEFAEKLGINTKNFPHYIEWTEAVASSVSQSPLSVINCPNSSDASCLTRQVSLFVTRAFRGDVTEEKVAEFVAFFTRSIAEAGFNQAVADLVFVVMNSPQFVFRYEFNPAPGKLSEVRILQNISYTLGDSPPEAFGHDSANAANLVPNAEKIQALVQQSLASSAAREKLARFFIKWLEVSEPDQIDIDPTQFPEFTSEVAQALVSEVKTFIDSQLVKAAPKLKDLTQATQAFVSAATAAIYGVSNNISGTKLVELNPTERFGILSHPAVIVSHSGPIKTALVKRGVFFVRKVMCMNMPPPPPDIEVNLPEGSYTTERQRIELATGKSPCLGCHASINPFGFMLESFGVTGQWRTLDNGAPVDSSLTIDGFDEGRIAATNTVEGLRSFTNTLRFKQCFVRQLFRFYMGRLERPSDDPILRQMFFSFADQDSQDMIRALQILATSDLLTQRGQ